MHGLGLSPAAGENQLFSAGRRYTNLRECVLQSMASCSMGSPRGRWPGSVACATSSPLWPAAATAPA